MARFAITFLLTTLVLLSSWVPVARAADISARLLPDTTKGYFCLPDYQLAQRQWDAMQLGELLNDPAMEPFMQDLSKQLRGRRGADDVQLGVELDELEDIANGEVAMATIQPGGKAGAHAQAVIAQVTGNEPAAKQLLAKIGKNLIAQRAARSTFKVGAVEVAAYRLPRKRGQLDAENAYHFLHKDILVTTDHEQVVRDIATRLQTPAKGNTLAHVAAFEKSMEQTADALGELTAHVRWFVEPFGFLEVSRAARGEEKKRGTDLLNVLRNQGFDAIQGVGGQMVLKTEGHEMLHRTLIYAPGAKGDSRFELAARMLQFPNLATHDPQAWVPANVATYVTWNWKMREAFDFSRSMVNELAGAKAGEDLFEDILGSIRDDVAGPRVDLRNELVQHLAERATLFTDYREPITPQSERLMFAIQLTDSKKVANAIRKIMESDPDAKRRMISGQVVWEIVSEKPAEVEQIRIVGAGFGPFNEPEPTEEEDEPILPNMAITVANGHLMVASHIDFMTDVLAQTTGEKSLANSKDYLETRRALGKLTTDKTSLSFFSRSDKAYRPTYELIRQGKMPESESMLGKFLNRMIGPDEAGVVREQEIDGAKMPPFSKVKQYLGPAGISINSREDGWFVTGCLQAR